MNKTNTEIKQILREAIINKNYGIIFEKLSFEERKKILFDTNGEFADFLSFWAFNVYGSLFNEEEAESIYKNCDTSLKNKVLLCCSDSFKFNEFNNYTGDYSIYLNSFKDENIKLNVLDEFFLKLNLNKYNLSRIISSFSVDFQSKMLDVIFKYNENNSLLDLSLYDVNSLVESIDSSIRVDCIKRFLSFFGDLTENVLDNRYGIDRIIGNVAPEFQLDIFNEFIELNNKIEFDLFKYNLSSIFSQVDDSVKLDFIVGFLENNLIEEKYNIISLFDHIPDNLKDEALFIFYDYEEVIDELLIDDYIISEILTKYSSDKFLDKFEQKVLMAPDRYDSFYVVKYFIDNNIKFSALNLLVKNELITIDDRKRSELFETLSKEVDNYENRVPNGDVLYDDLIDFYAEELFLNRDNFREFIRVFGYTSLRYVDSEAIRKVINLDEINFYKFMSLFDRDNLELDNDTLNNIVHAVLNREFLLNCKEDYTIFARLDGLIKNGKFEEFQKEFLNMATTINIYKLLKKNNISTEDFLKELINGNSSMLEVLHELTNEYIKKRRENYVNGRLVNINDELDLNKKYEKNFIVKKYIATTSIEEISYDIRYNINFEGLDDEYLQLKNDYQLLGNIIKFKKNPREVEMPDKSKLKLFDDLISILYENDRLKDSTNDVNAKYIYFSKKVSSDYLLSVISSLDVSSVRKNLLEDDDLFEELEKLVKKYKLLGWNETFSSFKEKADFEFSSDTLVGIINYFYKIYPDSFDKNIFGLTKFVSLANCYVSASSKYALLYGYDNYVPLAANAGKNKSSWPKHRRLSMGVDHVVGMYKRDKVPVPPMDEGIQLDNGKNVNVVVGNTTNMSNLVLGELTNSCMRIGGQFDDFYRECLTGDDGFHIVFLEPQTEKFISRVSGIRNGNTLFLNELRDSENSLYNDEDCVDAIYKVAQMLVERSKNSEFPIDNVVITADYAMEIHKDKLQNLRLRSRRSAVRGLNHNLSSDGFAIVLATSNEDNSLVKVELDVDKISYYKPQRSKIHEYVGDEAVKKVLQLKGLINEILNGNSFSELAVKLDLDVVRCVAGNDWYISIDSKGNIEQFILDRCNDKERALEEMHNYSNVFNDYIEKGVVR